MVAFVNAAGGDEPGRAKPGPKLSKVECVGIVPEMKMCKQHADEMLGHLQAGTLTPMAGVAFCAMKGEELYLGYAHGTGTDPNNLCRACFQSGLATGYSAAVTVISDAFGVSAYRTEEELRELKKKLAACGAAITTANGVSPQIEECLLAYQDTLLKELELAKAAKARSARQEKQFAEAKKAAEAAAAASLKPKGDQPQGEPQPSSEPKAEEPPQEPQA